MRKGEKHSTASRRSLSRKLKRVWARDPARRDRHRKQLRAVSLKRWAAYRRERSAAAAVPN